MALTYTQITAITEKFFLKNLADNIYGTNPALARLARPGKKMMIEGGEKIVAPIISSAPGEGGAFTDLDTLSTDRTDNISAAEVDWRQYHEPIRVSRLDLLKNAGDAAKLRLVASKIAIAKKAMKDHLGTGLFGSGGSNTLDGLGLVMSSSSTYAGIAVADLATWIAGVVTNSGTNRALTLDLMQQTWGGCSFDEDIPTVIFGKQATVDQVWSLFQPHQRLMSSEMTKLGFENILMFNGAPVIADSHMAANKLYFVNENYFFLGVHQDEDMREEVFEKLESSASMLRRIFWAGNVICTQRRAQGVLEDISVAS